MLWSNWFYLVKPWWSLLIWNWPWLLTRYIPSHQYGIPYYMTVSSAKCNSLYLEMWSLNTFKKQGWDGKLYIIIPLCYWNLENPSGYGGISAKFWRPFESTHPKVRHFTSQCVTPRRSSDEPCEGSSGSKCSVGLCPSSQHKHTCVHTPCACYNKGEDQIRVSMNKLLLIFVF